MNKKLLFVCFSLMSIVGIAQPSNGLVAHYSGDGNVNDITANQLHGTNSGATYGNDRNENPLSAIYFNGSSGIAIDPVISELVTTNSGTWSAWVKLTDATPSQNQTILMFGDDNFNRHISLRIFTSGAIHFSSQEWGNNKFAVQTNEFSISDNEWFHLTVVQDGVQPKIYVNGMLQASTNVIANDLTSWFHNSSQFDNARIGHLDQNNIVQNYLNGALDDILIYNRALTEQEITDMLSISPSESAGLWSKNGNDIYYSDGNVGIGTTTPNAPLEISYNVSGTPSNSTGLIVRNTLGDSSSLGQAEIKLIPAGLQNEWSVSANDDTNLFRIYSGNISRFAIDGATGNVGIGTNTPSEKLEVNGNLGIAGGEGEVYQLGPAKNSTTGLSVRSVINPSVSENLFTVESSGATSRFGVTQANGAWIRNGLHVGAQYDSGMPAMNGNLIVDAKVGIGTMNPDEKLTVKGTIHAEEVKVDLSVPGPDYVFEEDYNLRSLKETETYIQANKHLPEVPSAKEMEVNGIQLGEMNMLLLKKIEELTLHLIEKDHQVSELQKQIIILSKKVNELESN